MAIPHYSLKEKLFLLISSADEKQKRWTMGVQASNN